ncbi:hypothetical protein SAMN04487946_1263, partial [Halobellus clavatus]
MSVMKFPQSGSYLLSHTKFNRISGEAPGRLDQFFDLLPTNFSSPNECADLGIGQLLAVLETPVQFFDVGVVLNRDRDVH